MTGRAVEYVFPDRQELDVEAETLLKVEKLGLQGSFSDVSLEIRAGEVVGLAGLVGSGRSEILETIYGARRASTRTVSVAGKRLRAGSVTSAVDAGIGLCPEERKSQGLLLDEPVYRNITLSTFDRFAKRGFLDERLRRRRPSRQSPSTCGPPGSTATPAPSPEATSRRRSSPAGSCAAAASCCSTSRPAGSTSAHGPRSTP